MDQDQEVNEPVSTGFEELAAQAPPPAPPPVAEPSPEQSRAEALNRELGPTVSEKDEPINFVQPAPPAMSEAARKNQELYQRIMASRNQPPAVIPVQPPVPRITEQTRLEMEEGKRMNAVHSEHRSKNPMPIERRQDAIVAPVGRPEVVPGLMSIPPVVTQLRG